MQGSGLQANVHTGAIPTLVHEVPVIGRQDVDDDRMSTELASMRIMLIYNYYVFTISKMIKTGMTP